MKNLHKILSSFLLILLLPVFQQCTHDIPLPNPTTKPEIKSVLLKEAKSTSNTLKGAVSGGNGGFASQRTLPIVCYNYYTVYYDNTGAEVGRDFLYSDCPVDDGNSGGGGEGGVGGGSGGGFGSGGTSGLSPTTVLVAPPNIPVTDIRQFLKCFNTSQSAMFSVYARQPRPGTPTTWASSSSGPDVGHTFVSITQNGITRVFGFYPISDKAILDDGPGIFGDNGQTKYSIKITTTISQGDLNSLLTYIYSHSNNNYSLTDYNCTDFGIGAAGAAGLTLPDTYGNWGIGGGSTPGTLGQDMRTMPLPTGASRTLSGVSPTNTGGC